VFAIWAVLLSLAVPSFLQMVQRLQGQCFMEKLSVDIIYAANEALSQRGKVKIEFSIDYNQYVVRRSWQMGRRIVNVPRGFTIYSNFNNGTIVFNELGHVGQAGSFYLVYPDGMKKRLTVYMASGRVAVSTVK
jgi:Tfp pilus assembly protein FimT